MITIIRILTKVVIEHEKFLAKILATGGKRDLLLGIPASTETLIKYKNGKQKARNITGRRMYKQGVFHVAVAAAAAAEVHERQTHSDMINEHVLYKSTILMLELSKVLIKQRQHLGLHFYKILFFFFWLLDKYKKEIFLMKKDSMRQSSWILQMKILSLDK